MTGDEVELDLTQRDRRVFPVEIPAWVPAGVAKWARNHFEDPWQVGRPTTAEYLANAVRLTVDPRMQTVWSHLRQTRRLDGQYENIYAWSANGNALRSTATDRDVAKPADRKPGPSPKHNWPIVVAAELIRLVHEEGIPKNDSKVADRLSQFCQDRFQWQPADSEIRKLVADLLRSVRAIPANSS